MFSADNINYIEFKLLESQVDLVLDALQLYAFNFHRVWAIDKDSNFEDLRNSMIFHTYEQIQGVYNTGKYSHKEYNILYECRLNSKRNKIKKYKIAKNIA